MKRVLLTGSAGVIGTSLLNSLGHLYRFRCIDLRPTVGQDDVVVGNLLDPACLGPAMQDMEAVIHLAGRPGFDQGWHENYVDGIGATYQVFEAARQAGIKKVIYASSMAVLGWTEMHRGQRVSPDMPLNPHRLYGISKATGELLARYFSETYGMSITCLRIGAFFADPPPSPSIDDPALRAWCSPEDLAQLVRLCLEGDELGFQVYYAVSNHRERLWDVSNARRLIGYRPVRNAEDIITPARGSHSQPAPSGLLEVLMKAALQDGTPALASWRTWSERVDFEHAHLDGLSYRLLPLVYSNLATLGLEDPFLNKLKGVYRRAWLENQLALEPVVPFVRQLQERGIQVLAMDDLGATLRLYDGQGMRRLYSLHLLVHPEHVPDLIAFLGERKIWPKVTRGDRFLNVEQTLEVWPPFELPLRVAWRAHPAIRTPAQAMDTWRRATVATLGEHPLPVLDLESLFLRSCLCAVEGRTEASFFALFDVAWILRKNAEATEWERVVKLAKENQQVLPVIACLTRLSRLVDTPVADQLLAQLRSLPAGGVERLELRYLYSHQPYAGPWVHLVRRLLLYRRSIKVPGPLGFFRYIQYVWGGPRLRSIVRLAWRHVRAAVRGSAS